MVGLEAVVKIELEVECNKDEVGIESTGSDSNRCGEDGEDNGQVVVEGGSGGTSAGARKQAKPAANPSPNCPLSRRPVLGHQRGESLRSSRSEKRRPKRWKHPMRNDSFWADVGSIKI